MDQTHIIEQSEDVATGSLIFLHGSGDTGRGVADNITYCLGYLKLPQIRLIFPTAPAIPFTPFGGTLTNTWYDINEFSDSAIEKMSDIEDSAKFLSSIIDEEVAQGIPLNRIAVAGFSRGGGMSFYMGYMFKKELAGVGVISSWLPTTSPIYEVLKKKTDEDRLPPLWHVHGSRDNIINAQFAARTYNSFRKANLNTQFKLYPGIGHELRHPMFKDLLEFVKSVIPETDPLYL